MPEYTITKNAALGIYRIFEDSRWIAEVYNRRDAEHITETLTAWDFTRDNCSEFLALAPTQSTDGRPPPSPPDATAPPP
jgi:hypothetical protein